MRGRKPKPSNLHVLQGTTRPDRKNRREPHPQVMEDVPEPPDFLDDVARAEWFRVGRELLSAGLLARLDTTALAAYAVTYSQWSQSIMRIRKHGMLVKTPNGYPVQSPFVSMANKAFVQMLRMLAEFGMTPSSRSRIASGLPADNPNDLDMFLNGG